MKHLSTTVLKDCTRISASIDRVVAPTPAGRLRAFVLHPTHDAGRAPLVVLHGISRNAKELARLFALEAARSSFVEGDESDEVDVSDDADSPRKRTPSRPLRRSRYRPRSRRNRAIRPRWSGQRCLGA